MDAVTPFSIPISAPATELMSIFANQFLTKVPMLFPMLSHIPGVVTNPRMVWISAFHFCAKVLPISFQSILSNQLLTASPICLPRSSQLTFDRKVYAASKTALIPSAMVFPSSFQLRPAMKPFRISAIRPAHSTAIGRNLLLIQLSTTSIAAFKPSATTLPTPYQSPLCHAPLRRSIQSMTACGRSIGCSSKPISAPPPPPPPPLSFCLLWRVSSS